jgi:hypothetical protein
MLKFSLHRFCEDGLIVIPIKQAQQMHNGEYILECIGRIGTVLFKETQFRNQLVYYLSVSPANILSKKLWEREKREKIVENVR